MAKGNYVNGDKALEGLFKDKNNQAVKDENKNINANTKQENVIPTKSTKITVAVSQEQLQKIKAYSVLNNITIKKLISDYIDTLPDIRST